MTTFTLEFTLKSDATFGSGEGIAGYVDVEVQHDRFGCPYLGGRTLKGLLVEECANILYALEQQEKPLTDWEQSAQRLFGNPGSTAADQSVLHVGSAQLPADLRAALAYGCQQQDNPLTPQDVLDSLTATRRQTAIDPLSGAPLKESLRAMRVVLRETTFVSELVLLKEPAGNDLPLLAACVLALRRVGTGRNRGRGEVAALLRDQAGKDITGEQFAIFCKHVEAQS